MVTAWSDGALDLVGYTADEVVNRPARELLAEDTRADTLANLSGIVVLRHRDGTSVPLFPHPVARTGAVSAATPY